MGLSILTPHSTLRQKILSFVAALILLTLFGSAFSLYRIVSVENTLDAINRVFIPLGRLLSQIQSDADIFHRELERRLGYSHWKDPHWRARPIPKWIEEILESEMTRAQAMVRRVGLPWEAIGSQDNWQRWLEELSAEFNSLRTEALNLYVALEKKDEDAAAQIYPRWISSLEGWRRQLHWGVSEYEKKLRESFTRAETQVSELKTGLQVVLGVVLALSLLLLWLSERALRPLGDLTRIAKEITRRGLKKEDKAALPSLSIARQDEVNELTREFHRMATALLEREKTIEQQKSCLEEQNRELLEMVGMKERLRQAENLAAVGKMSAQVAHEVRNPLHSIGLEAEMAVDVVSKIDNISQKNSLKNSLQSILTSTERLEKIIENYLRLSRLSSGKKSWVNLQESLSNVLATYSSLCETQGVKVDWSMAAVENNHSVWGDPDLIEFALGNLMRNALQAVEGKELPRIIWSIDKKGNEEILIQVMDNGIGITPEIRPKLFSPFFTTKSEGTGLGLSFVKMVFEEHGGSIDCRDLQGEGLGACFEVSLPAVTTVVQT